MDVFEIQRRLVDDYRSYVESFVKIRDPHIRSFVAEEYGENKYWPEALVQLNPAFAPGSWIDDLVGAGTLHPRCQDIFRVGDRKLHPMRLHLHQEEALRAAQTGSSYILTTGTGSGKSLAYFVPIIDRVLRKGSGRGLTAIVVYPMNALCNSQLDELAKFLGPTETAPVTYERYTGQESDEKRNEIRANPPDILLTNYVMLELILTRSEDRMLLDKASNLEFFVLDELHTYRGRQGADVAMLTRRVRERTGAVDLQCIGTSATMVSEGDRAKRLQQVAAVATTLFGTPVVPENVIDETLSPLFAGLQPDADALRLAVSRAAEGHLPDSVDGFLADPMAAWVEQTFGAEERDGRIERVTPRTISDGANVLAASVSLTPPAAASAIRGMLMRGYDLKHKDTGRPLFAFRLHQFISRGDTVFSTLDRGRGRRMTLDGQTVLPGEHGRRLYPLAFCRHCGEDYFVVDKVEQIDRDLLRPRDFREMSKQEETERISGYVWLDSGADDDLEPFAFQLERIPDQHLTTRAGGVVGPTSQLMKRLVPAEVAADGRITIFDENGPAPAWFIRGRLPFCLRCGEAWDPNVGEFTKLGTLASEGRAGATTIISLKLVQALRASDDLPEEARKLLSFTDNRQDASLQAGHFNDFIVTSLLRSGILAALPLEGATTFDRLPGDIFACLNLDLADFMKEGLSRGARRRADAALRDVLAYRMFRDLRRGWRVNQPNLEQLGLLRITYNELDATAADDAFWQREVPEMITTLRSVRQRDEDDWLAHPDLDGVVRKIADLESPQRAELLGAVLEHFRREGAVQARILTEHELTALRDRAHGNLNDLWGFDVDEVLEPARPLRVARSQRRGNSEKAVDITPLSRTGRTIAMPAIWGALLGSKPMKTDHRLLVLHVLARALVEAGYLIEEGDEGYLLSADELRWQRGSDAASDSVNSFFRDFYQTLADALPIDDAPVNIRGMRAREHTAQVPSVVRAEREGDFREGKLPVMYSSPTMELGVDISSLNAVNMRNVPPTPANYAQRSGRAGRANQPAIVVTYCAASSPHDQYYFHRRNEMVAGVVTPPRIDLANRDLIASHMHAVWLAETGARLPSSLGDLLDVRTAGADLPILDQYAMQIGAALPRERAYARCERILSGIATELTGTRWYRPGWIDTLLDYAPKAFDDACDRWRSLYRSAVEQIEIQGKRSNDLALDKRERDRADRLRAEARRQRDLLVERQMASNDFYTYRYLASEGFLPGYNFPRLPLTAYIPGRRGGENEGEYLQRPRFIAITEYGPGNSIYYEGNRYRVERISLPTSTEQDASVTETMKVCGSCGYAHTGALVNADVCVNPICGAVLDNAFHRDNMLRLQSVITRRVERISSEEEERQRQGFDFRTAIQFGETPQGPDYVRGELAVDGGEAEAELTYAPSARLWRINLGWRRRRDKHTHGFWLDMTRGVWSRKEDPESENGAESPEVSSSDLRRVIPYVDDHQNALLLTLKRGGRDRLKGDEHRVPSVGHYLSLGYALKRGICIAFQLEDGELDTVLLPDDESPHSIAFFESSEGGAGVLTRLLEEPGAMARVAREALTICHFDPDTGKDHGLDADCGIACYQCLLSYTNQPDHESLDRYLVRDVLRDWQRSQVLERDRTMTREQLRDELKKLTQSSLEDEFVDWLYAQGHRLPDAAQKLFENPWARPDFHYEAARACVYVDGSPHDDPAIREKDRADRRVLERRHGVQVISVSYPSNWPEEVAAWPDVFGEGVSE